MTKEEKELQFIEFEKLAQQFRKFSYLQNVIESYTKGLKIQHQKAINNILINPTMAISMPKMDILELWLIANNIPYERDYLLEVDSIVSLPKPKKDSTDYWVVNCMLDENGVEDSLFVFGIINQTNKDYEKNLPLQTIMDRIEGVEKEKEATKDLDFFNSYIFNY